MCKQQKQKILYKLNKQIIVINKIDNDKNRDKNI